VACTLKAGEEAEIKQTGSLTKDLCELYQWFIDHRIEEVAIESTGNYWHALYGVFTDASLCISLFNRALCK
jgi:hypothetical protein